MFRLRTLGGLDLSDPEGRGVGAILAQPKRLALLVHLAVVDSHRYRRRDTVVSLFWPELDDEHARGALRQALRFIRTTLGPEVIVNRGEEEIGVDPAALQCDAAEFERACDQADWRRALELYRGDLLTGVYIADASADFEQWLEGERDRLRRRAAQAARALVEAAEREGDPVAAAPWALRAVELAPDDEAGVRRLIRILDSRGDRAGALRAYEQFRARMEREYAAAPSPETEALVAAIRTRAVKIWESPLRGWPPEGTAG